MPAPAPMSVVPPTVLGDPSHPPHHTSDHQEIVTQPGAIPVDSKNTSFVETRTPAPATMGNIPPGTAATLPPGSTVGVPAGGGPTTVANIPATAGPGTTAPPPATVANVPSSGKPPAQVWDTNHPKPSKPPKASNLSNVPTAPAPTDPVLVHNIPSNGGAPAPVLMESDVPNVPPAGGGAMDPAGKTKTSGGGKGVHWSPHLPGKEVASTPAKTPK